MAFACNTLDNSSFKMQPPAFTNAPLCPDTAKQFAQSLICIM